MRRIALAAILLSLCAARAGAAERVEPIPLVPRSGERTLFDFEDGRLPEPSFSGYGLEFFIANRWNTGVYAPSIDAERGANGTRRSLRLDVERGSFYFYVTSKDRRRYIDAARGANRMEFFLKLPEGWGARGRKNQNLNIGTYLRDPRVWKGEPESGNNHHYFQLFLVPDGDWVRVVTGEAPHHQRDVSSFDPAETTWRPGIARFYDALTRFYICGVPNDREGWSPAPPPYRVWFDELSFYYEDERLETHPEYSERRAAPGEAAAHRIRVTNTHPTETRRFAYFVHSRQDAWRGKARLVDREGRAVARTPALRPGESDEVVLIESVPAMCAPDSRPRVTNVVVAQVEPPPAPADPRVENRSLFAARGDAAAPAAGTLCVTRVVARPLAAAGADGNGARPATLPRGPARILDLALAARSEDAAEVSWTAPAGAAAYDLRIALRPILTAEDFARAMPLPGEPTPGPAGRRERARVPALEPGRRYHVAIRAEDAEGPPSAVSNDLAIPPAIARPASPR